MSDAMPVREIESKRQPNGDGHAGDVHQEHIIRSRKAEDREEAQAADTGAVSPTKPGRRPWVWALMGAVAIAVTAAGVAYYIHSLAFESTDDAFIDGHIIPVSSRVAGHVARVYVTDNQQVKEGDLLAELDPADFETRLAAAKAALQTAQADWQGPCHWGRGGQGRLGAEQGRSDGCGSTGTTGEGPLKRIESLVPEHAASQDSLEEATAVARVAHAEMAAMREKVNAKQSAIEASGVGGGSG